MKKVYVRLLTIGIKEEKVFGINFMFSFLTLPLQALISYYLWKKGMGEAAIRNFTMNTMVIYFFLQTILMISYEGAMMTAYEVNTDISTGKILSLLLKPISYPLMLFFKKIGFFFLRIFVGYTSVLVFAAILGETLHSINIIYSLLFAAISFTLLFQIQMIIGLLAFRFKNIILLRDFVMDILWILGGVVIPLDFFPKALSSVLSWTVIPLIHYMPGKLLVNPFMTKELLIVFLSGVLRIVLYSFVIKLIWKVDSTKANQGA
ncbi:MAG: ABC-2 family transporter protein [Tissierellia bacterium]|nr:ABC-2 family transporter protein [Tissierellia bacterium]